MKKRYKLVLYDLDGTLLDTSTGIYAGIDYVTEQMGFAPLSDDIKALFIGPPAPENFEKYLGITGDTLTHAVDLYRGFNASHGYKLTEEYAGMPALLHVTKDIPAVVATMKRQDMADKTVDYAGYTPYFSHIYGNTDFNPLSKAELIKKACTQVGCRPEEALLIGDTELDAAGAKEAGCDFAAAAYGFGFTHASDINAYPSVLQAKHPQEIIAYLEQA